MEFLKQLGDLFSNVTNITWQQLVMWGIGALLIFLAIKKNMEPTLPLMGMGMLGIFLVILVIVLTTVLLNKLGNLNKDNRDE